MDENFLKFLLLGLLIVFIFFVCVGVTVYCCQRRKRKGRIHLEKVTVTNSFESPHLPYKQTTAAAGIHTIQNGYKPPVNENGVVKNGFSEVFHGTPPLPHKTYEAPSPPNVSDLSTPQSKVIQSSDLRSVIVISNYGDFNNNSNLDEEKDFDDQNSQTASSTNVSPKSVGERLSLKNRPFKIELAESKVEAAVSAAVSPNSAHNSSSSASSPTLSVKTDYSQQNNVASRNNVPLSPITKFPTKMEKLQENENEMLYYEFEILNQEAMTSIKPRTTTAELNENIRKNRFYDILPYDFNRVKLNVQEDDSGNRKSDYINASYINSDDGSLRYIAAQGPIGEEESKNGQRSNTVSDFWQMVWQEHVNTIVMLTECVEGVRQKCAIYWPENAGDETIQVGNDLSVNLYCITEDEICFQREMFLHKVGQPKRKVVQWHYKNWRDSAGAQDTDNLLTFMETIRNSEKRLPVLVHCSAGVGRTGVFLALDMLIEKLVRENVIDVFETVSRLRESRTCMVQTGEQYLTIYEVIALAIRRRSAIRSSG